MSGIIRILQTLMGYQENFIETQPRIGNTQWCITVLYYRLRPNITRPTYTFFNFTTMVLTECHRHTCVHCVSLTSSPKEKFIHLILKNVLLKSISSGYIFLPRSFLRTPLWCDVICHFLVAFRPSVSFGLDTLRKPS